MKAISDLEIRRIMLKGFISYARADAQDVSVDLERQLAELDGSGIARFWIDRQLRTGDEWEGRLLRELNKAEVVVVIVTPRAMERSSYMLEVQSCRLFHSTCGGAT